MNRGQQLTLWGGICLVAGALLPWAKVTSTFLGMSISKAGYEGDGLFTGAIGLLLLISAILSKGKPGKVYSIASTIFAVIAGLILFSDLTGINSLVSNGGSSVMASAGVGIYVSIIGVVFAIIGGLQNVPSLPVPETTQSNP